jgi:hypothetical protein
MKLPIEKIKFLLNKFHGEFVCKYLEDIHIKGQILLSEQEVRMDDIIFLEKNNINEVDIIYTVTQYDYLVKEFPLEYRKPYAMADFIEIDKLLERFDKVNARSKRKRCITMVGDIYTTDTRSGKRLVIIGHNERLDYKKWNEIKPYMYKDHKFFFRNVETKIIIFVNMKATAETSYIERFKKNTDLLSTMILKKKDARIDLAPDFIPAEDVISVTDPDKLLEEYIKSNARLIIIGENISDSYRNALLSVKQYDRFVRLMVVPNVDMSNTDHFLQQVKLVYNSDRWNE